MSNPSATPSLTPPTPTPRSEKLDPMDQHAERQLAAAGNYPQSGSPGRRRGELDGQADNGGRMEVDQSNAHRQSLSLLPSSNHPRSTEVSPTTTTGNFHSHVAIDPSLTTTGDNAGLGGGGEQREPLTGPTRTHSKPAPLNLRSISNSSTLQAPGSCIGPGNEAASPYAGHYAQRLERRASQYPVSAGAGYNQASMSATSSPQPPPAQQQAASITTDESMRYPGSDRPPARPAPLAHSASLPVLPSQDPMTSSSPATYPSHPHQGAPGSTTGQGQGQNYSRAYSYGYGQGAGESSNAQQPPPFPHAYSSPAVPMYPPGSHSHHYPGYTHMPPGYPSPMQHHHASSYQPYPPQQHYRGPGAPGTLASPSFVGSGATGGYPAPHPSSNSTGNTPGVLVIGANGQIMPHNAAQMVGGRGTPLSERPFKCDECVQSFNRNHDLKRHKRIHLAVKPFACEKCGKQFSRKDALRRHWLVKGCKASDDPNVNMANPAYQGSKTSSASPSNSTPPSLPQHHHMHQPPPQHAYANHPTMLRTPSYGGGPMVVTPDDEAFGAYNNGYSMHPQFRQPMPPTNMSANTSPASTRPPGGSIGYGAPPARPLDRVPTPGSATFPGQLDPAITANTMSEPVSSTTNTKLPGRYSLDARLHTTSSPSLERNDLGTRSASVSMPLTDGNHHKRTHGPPVMVLQADGMIEQTVQLPGQPNTTIKRMSRDGYFEGAFNGGHENGSGGMDQALDSYVSVPASTAPKSASASSPSFAMPFDKSSRESLEASTNNGPGSDAWNSTPRWHRPSFPFPPAGSSVYRAPDSMEDSTDLRKSISHRASVSQQHHHQQQQQANFANGSGSSIRPAQRWTRASFPFPEKPDNGMGIRSGDTNQQ